MMWALEYDPDMFSVYEESSSEDSSKKTGESKGKSKPIQHFGRFEREKLKNRSKNPEDPLPISVFLVASVLESKSAKLLTEARGLDDVVKVSSLVQFDPICFIYASN